MVGSIGVVYSRQNPRQGIIFAKKREEIEGTYMSRLLTVVLVLMLAFIGATNAAAQTKFDPRDFSGVWGRFGSRAGETGVLFGGGCQECGDPGFGVNVPPFTPEGKAKFDANKPAYGRAAASPVVPN